MGSKKPQIGRAIIALALTAVTTSAQDAVTLRFYQGVTAYVNNPRGKAFGVALKVRDWNLLENGPRELLFKVYDPDGRVLVREVIEDDGVSANPYLPETGGWDHEMWYYALCYGRGSRPMIRWSSMTDPGRVASLSAREVTRAIPRGAKGVYRVMVVGSRDHIVTMRVNPELKFGLAGHPIWLHGHGEMLERSYVYVPKGTTGLHLAFAEFDPPVTRHLTITAPGGEKLWDGPAKGGFQSRSLKLEEPQKFADKMLDVEVSEGAGDFMLHIQMRRADVRPYRGTGGVPAVFAPDKRTAKALRGGAIYHDGQIFWHGLQVRFHDWLKALGPEAFVVKDAEGRTLEPTKGRAYGWGRPSLIYKGLPERPDYVPLNGAHEAPPLCDSLMHHYPAHKNRNVLNVALRDLAKGLRCVTVGDGPVSGFNGNYAYIFASYGWHYWRPAWRILQQSDAPQEVKDVVHEAMILCGDRLAFGRGIERVNGNAFSHVPMSLHYCAAATQDSLQRQLADTYFDRFVSEGWGRGTGISRSGDCQEHFAHDYHYGTYIFANYRAIVTDFGYAKFQKVLDRLTNLYGYLYCAETNAFAWDARTHHGVGSLTRYGVEWKGEPGPDFTVSVNDGDEWFAARRPTYYALTFHGRLAPMWMNHYFGSRLGYGGGMICQLTVPGRGTVLASTLRSSYGKGSEPRNWRKLHIHSVVGELTDGRALVAADSIHHNARLEGYTVSSSGEVRDRPVRVTRRYTFGKDDLTVEVQLADTDLRAAYWNMGPPSTVREAYEMIPFVPTYWPATPKGEKRREKAKTSVTAAAEDGKSVALTEETAKTKTVIIDRGGCGVRIELPSVMGVHQGESSTVLIHLTEGVKKAEEISLSYRIVPFVQP